jgi:hypothetical protein
MKVSENPGVKEQVLNCHLRTRNECQVLESGLTLRQGHFRSARISFYIQNPHSF